LPRVLFDATVGWNGLACTRSSNHSFAELPRCNHSFAELRVLAVTVHSPNFGFSLPDLARTMNLSDCAFGWLCALLSTSSSHPCNQSSRHAGQLGLQCSPLLLRSEEDHHAARVRSQWPVRCFSHHRLQRLVLVSAAGHKVQRPLHTMGPNTAEALWAAVPKLGVRVMSVVS
jgi:hypothetical protein